jgi:hypothetical protein
MVKSGFAVTIRVSVDIWLTVPAVPVNVIVKVPADPTAGGVTSTVVVTPAAVGVIEVVPKTVVAPVGAPLRLSVTGAEKP